MGTVGVSYRSAPEKFCSNHEKIAFLEDNLQNWVFFEIYGEFPSLLFQMKLCTRLFFNLFVVYLVIVQVIIAIGRGSPREARNWLKIVDISKVLMTSDFTKSAGGYCI